MSEWKMVPTRQSQSQFDAISERGVRWKDTNSVEIYELQVAAAPPLPAEVLEQMVERGAKAMYLAAWEMAREQDMNATRVQFRAGLLAALGESK